MLSSSSTLSPAPLGETAWDTLAGHDLLLVGHRATHGVGIHLRVCVGLHTRRRVSSLKTLLLGDRAVLVCEQESLEIHDFFSELRNLACQSIVFTTEHFDFGLEVGKPLLLTLTTFQSGNTRQVRSQ